MFLKIKYLLLATGILLQPISSRAQSDGKTDDIAAIVLLDSLTVTARRAGFSVAEFINLVQTDETFYEAFRNLRFSTYTATNTMSFRDKSGAIEATYESKTRQFATANCRSMDVLEERTTGNFYKRNRKYRYYTARLFDRVFFTHGTICEEQNEEHEPPRGMVKHVEELKKLIFQPGTEVNVPLIGSKTAIFSEKMMPYYDYAILAKDYNGTECYVFQVSVKPQFTETKEGKTIIKHMETYFERSNFQVVARAYQLAYRGALFDFDVTMNIELGKVKGAYIPVKITYDGWWNIPTRKIEIGSFATHFYNFK